MNNFHIKFPHNVTGFDPGAEISVHVAWNFPSPPQAIEARLVWNTAGKGDQDLKVVKTIHIENPAASDEREIVLELPWGPYSFSGKLISLIWAIELVALPENISLRREITVAPQGREVVLSGPAKRHS